MAPKHYRALSEQRIQQNVIKGDFGAGDGNRTRIISLEG